ncbi:MAG: DUF3568 family protein, partial [Smithella sp.]
MANKTVTLLFLVFLLLTGCDAAINMNGKIASINSGKFLYQDGNLVSNYKANIDMVWQACEKSVS